MEDIPLIPTYLTFDSKTVFVEKSDYDRLIKDYGSLDKVPEDITIEVHELHPETGNLKIYKASGKIRISEINKLKKKDIRCTDFSTFH